jgi:hypothetical protein
MVPYAGADYDYDLTLKSTPNSSFPLQRRQLLTNVSQIIQNGTTNRKRESTVQGRLREGMGADSMS